MQKTTTKFWKRTSNAKSTSQKSYGHIFRLSLRTFAQDFSKSTQKIESLQRRLLNILGSICLKRKHSQLLSRTQRWSSCLKRVIRLIQLRTLKIWLIRSYQMHLVKNQKTTLQSPKKIFWPPNLLWTNAFKTSRICQKPSKSRRNKILSRHLSLS